VDVAALYEALASARPQVLVHSIGVSGIAVLQKIHFRDGTKRPDLLERSHLGLAEAVGPITPRHSSPAIAVWRKLALAAYIGAARVALLSARRPASAESIRARVPATGPALLLAPGSSIGGLILPGVAVVREGAGAR